VWCRQKKHQIDGSPGTSSGKFKQAYHLFIAHLSEIRVPGPDGHESFGAYGTDDFIEFVTKRLASLWWTHRHGHNDLTWFHLPERHGGRLHRHAGCQAVVHQVASATSRTPRYQAVHKRWIFDFLSFRFGGKPPKM
jgi:hypothetical protein